MIRYLRTRSAKVDGRLKVAAAVFFLVLCVAGPVAHTGADQQASRYALTAAIWDHGTVELSGYEQLLSRDMAVRDGLTYSDKAPLQPILAVPFYGAYRLVGGQPAEELEGPLYWYNDGLWWLTLWTSTMPGAALAALMYLWGWEQSHNTALLATTVLFFGSLLVVYSTLLFGHVLGALAVFAMFLLVRREQASTSHLIAAGVLGGMAVLIEYPLVLIVGLLAVAAVLRHRKRGLWVVAGGIPWAVLLGFYNDRLFGSPTTLSYQWAAFSEVRQDAAGALDIFAGPTAHRVLDVLFAPRGLIVGTPVLIVAVLGIYLLWRNRQRFDAMIAVAALVALLAVQFSWANSFAGGAGPRYLTPALPFLAAPLALAWQRWRRSTSLLAGISVLGMVAATFTNPQLPSEFVGGLGHWLRLASEGFVAHTVFTLRLGSPGWFVHGALVLIAGIWLVRLNHRQRDGDDVARAKLSWFTSVNESDSR